MKSDQRQMRSIRAHRYSFPDHSGRLRRDIVASLSKVSRQPIVPSQRSKSLQFLTSTLGSAHRIFRMVDTLAVAAVSAVVPQLRPINSVETLRFFPGTTSYFLAARFQSAIIVVAFTAGSRSWRIIFIVVCEGITDFPLRIRDWIGDGNNGGELHDEEVEGRGLLFDMLGVKRLSGLPVFCRRRWRAWIYVL